jgi:hypothetical protein
MRFIGNSKFRLCFLMIALLILSGCGVYPKGYTDVTERRLGVAITSIQEGIPFAAQRAQEWRKNLYLDYINVGFEGKEKIQSRKGQISYYFYEDNVKKNLDAAAKVEIDMEKNSIIYFRSTYGTSRKLLGSGRGYNMKTSEWTIDIDKAFEIAYKELGETRIRKYSNPKVVLRCFEVLWDFAIYSTLDAPYDDICIVINPKDGSIIRVDDKKR